MQWVTIFIGDRTTLRPRSSRARHPLLDPLKAVLGVKGFASPRQLGATWTPPGPPWSLIFEAENSALWPGREFGFGEGKDRGPLQPVAFAIFQRTYRKQKRLDSRQRNPGAFQDARCLVIS